MRQENSAIKKMARGDKYFGKKSSGLSDYQGVTVKGKKYTRFSQFDVTPASKKTTKEKLAGGIRLAIL